MQTGYRWAASISRLVLALPFLVACAQTTTASDWESTLYADHPLVGKLWHSASGEFVEQAALWDKLESAQYLLLGEKHDNPDHHVLQLRLINELIAQDQLSRVTFEMLDSSSSEALANLNTRQFSDLDELSDYLDWDVEGWDWDFYGPLVKSAYQASLPIYAGNISGETVGRIYGEPTPPEIASVFGDDVMQRLTTDIDESHCGLLPESQFASMVRIQQTRDYTMAQQLVSKDTAKLALLVAGNYHARHDLGVPNYLLAQDQALHRDAIVSLSFMEVQPGEQDPAVYLDRFSDQSAYDFIWFTPAVTSEDYCASLRQ
ncbi:MAG: ChaN family lipoprotein [Pseudomonadales bacterium]|nr:ChaN family lipoprotein [Pseudomonadales bacterium]